MGKVVSPGCQKAVSVHTATVAHLEHQEHSVCGNDRGCVTVHHVSLAYSILIYIVYLLPPLSCKQGEIGTEQGSAGCIGLTDDAAEGHSVLSEVEGTWAPGPIVSVLAAQSTLPACRGSCASTSTASGSTWLRGPSQTLGARAALWVARDRVLEDIFALRCFLLATCFQNHGLC